MNDIITCPICGKSAFQFKFSGKDYFYHTNNKKWDIFYCKNCGLEQIYPLPTFEEQSSFYPSNYYSYITKEEQSNDVKLNLLSRFGKKFYDFVDDDKFCLPSQNGGGKNFLDIGCGSGINLEKMNKRGWDSEGFEIDDKETYTNNIYYGKSIVDIKFSKKYDLIRCRHVFEHIDSPNEFLDKVYSLLNDDGIAIICLPNVKGISSYFLGKYAPDRDIPRHLFGYNYKNIQKLFIKHNFKIIHKNYLPNYSSFLGFQWAMYDKFNKKVESKFLQRIFGYIDLIFSFLGKTNQIGFILKKDNN